MRDDDAAEVGRSCGGRKEEEGRELYGDNLESERGGDLEWDQEQVEQERAFELESAQVQA